MKGGVWTQVSSGGGLYLENTDSITWSVNLTNNWQATIFGRKDQKIHHKRSVFHSELGHCFQKSNSFIKWKPERKKMKSFLFFKKESDSKNVLTLFTQEYLNNLGISAICWNLSIFCTLPILPNSTVHSDPVLLRLHLNLSSSAGWKIQCWISDSQGCPLFLGGPLFSHI